MRFNNEDYLKAFPREERAASPEKTIVTDEPGNVFDDQDETPTPDPEAADPEAAGGEDLGDE
jgi:hypothetical protein